MSTCMDRLAKFVFNLLVFCPLFFDSENGLIFFQEHCTSDKG